MPAMSVAGHFGVTYLQPYKDPMSRLLKFQGIFYFLTGVWPLVDIASFMAVTGPKTDLWLVRTVGWLILLSGIAFFFEGRSPSPSKNFARLACGEALALAGIDIYYVLKNTISWVYLIDATIELLLVIIWIIILARFRNSGSGALLSFSRV
jgi:hypothetical protein